MAEGKKTPIHTVYQLAFLQVGMCPSQSLQLVLHAFDRRSDTVSKKGQFITFLRLQKNLKPVLCSFNVGLDQFLRSDWFVASNTRVFIIRKSQGRYFKRVFAATDLV